MVSLRQAVSQKEGGVDDDLQAENVHRSIEIKKRKNSAFMIVEFRWSKIGIQEYVIHNFLIDEWVSIQAVRHLSLDHTQKLKNDFNKQVRKIAASSHQLFKFNAILF